MEDIQPKQRGLVHFTSSPGGAQIYIDGQILTNPDTEEALRTPAIVALTEGRRNFIMRLEGHEDVTGYVDIFPGVRVDIHRNFKTGTPGGGEKPEPQIWLEGKPKEGIPIPPGVRVLGIGTVNVTSIPLGAQIFIDGKPLQDEKGEIRKTPIILTDIPEGSHDFMYILSGYYKGSIVVYVIAEQITNAEAILYKMMI